MSTPASASTPASTRPARFLRGLAVFLLLAGIGFVTGLFLSSRLRPMDHLFGVLLDDRAAWEHNGISIALAVLLLIVMLVGWAYFWLRPRSSRGWLGFSLAGAAVVISGLVCLASTPTTALGLTSLTEFRFWKGSGSVAALGGATLLAVFLIARKLRPSSARGYVQLALAVAVILTIDLELVAFSPPFSRILGSWPRPFFNQWDTDVSKTLALIGVGIAFVLLPTLVVLAVVRRRLTSWGRIGVGYVLLAPVLVYLATDDAVIRRPLTMEELAPSFPGAEQSHEVLLRYGKNHPAGRDFRGPKRMYDHLVEGESLSPGDLVKWQAWLIHHRADIEAAWAEIAPVRAWWTELNAFDRIGDLTPPRSDAEIMTFQAPRVMSQLGCAIAGLQALDGHGDEAIDTLLPILQVGRKLQPSGRTLVRVMIAIAVERMAMQTASFILDHAVVSPAARARLADALRVGGGGAAGVRRLIATQYVFALNWSIYKPLGDLITGDRYSPIVRWGFNALSPFIYNPRATMNEYGDFSVEQQELAANRQFDHLQKRGNELMATGPRFKNFAGQAMLQQWSPAYSKLAESYWKTQDMRADLLARLEKM